MQQLIRQLLLSLPILSIMLLGPISALAISCKELMIRPSGPAPTPISFGRGWKISDDLAKQSLRHKKTADLLLTLSTIKDQFENLSSENFERLAVMIADPRGEFDNEFMQLLKISFGNDYDKWFLSPWPKGPFYRPAFSKKIREEYGFWSSRPGNIDTQLLNSFGVGLVNPEVFGWTLLLNREFAFRSFSKNELILWSMILVQIYNGKEYIEVNRDFSLKALSEEMKINRDFGFEYALKVDTFSSLYGFVSSSPTVSNWFDKIIVRVFKHIILTRPDSKKLEELIHFFAPRSSLDASKYPDFESFALDINSRIPELLDQVYRDSQFANDPVAKADFNFFAKNFGSFFGGAVNNAIWSAFPVKYKAAAVGIGKSFESRDNTRGLVEKWLDELNGHYTRNEANLISNYIISRTEKKILNIELPHNVKGEIHDKLISVASEIRSVLKSQLKDLNAQDTSKPLSNSLYPLKTVKTNESNRTLSRPKKRTTKNQVKEPETIDIISDSNSQSVTPNFRKTLLLSDFSTFEGSGHGALERMYKFRFRISNDWNATEQYLLVSKRGSADLSKWKSTDIQAFVKKLEKGIVSSQKSEGVKFLRADRQTHRKWYSVKKIKSPLRWLIYYDTHLKIWVLDFTFNKAAPGVNAYDDYMKTTTKITQEDLLLFK